AEQPPLPRRVGRRGRGRGNQVLGARLAPGRVRVLRAGRGGRLVTGLGGRLDGRRLRRRGAGLGRRVVPQGERFAGLRVLHFGVHGAVRLAGGLDDHHLAVRLAGGLDDDGI